MNERRILLTSGITNAPDGLEIVLDDGKESSVLRLRGRLGIDSSPALRDRLLAMLRERSQRTVVVDFAGLTYVDTSGIATLLEALKIARKHQSTLCLKGLQGRLLHLFKVAGVLPLFETDGCGSASSGLEVS